MMTFADILLAYKIFNGLAPTPLSEFNKQNQNTSKRSSVRGDCLLLSWYCYTNLLLVCDCKLTNCLWVQCLTFFFLFLLFSSLLILLFWHVTLRLWHLCLCPCPCNINVNHLSNYMLCLLPGTTDEKQFVYLNLVHLHVLCNGHVN